MTRNVDMGPANRLLNFLGVISIAIGWILVFKALTEELPIEGYYVFFLVISSQLFGICLIGCIPRQILWDTNTVTFRLVLGLSVHVFWSDIIGVNDFNYLTYRRTYIRTRRWIFFFDSDSMPDYSEFHRFFEYRRSKKQSPLEKQ
jgi:hypothetical protein